MDLPNNPYEIYNCDKLKSGENHSAASSFCTNCLDFLCRTCDINHQITFSDHNVIHQNIWRGKTLIDLKKKTSLLKQSVTAAKYNAVKNLEKAELYRNFAIEQVKEERHKINHALDQQKAKINAQFDELETTVMGQIVSTYNKDFEIMSKVVTETDELQAELEIISSDLDNSDVLNDSNNNLPEVFSKSEGALRQIKSSPSMSIGGSKNEISKYRFKPTWTLPTMQLEVSDFGNIESTGAMTTSGSVSLIFELNVKSPEDKETFNWIKGLCLFSDRMLIAADTYNNSLKVLDIETNQILSVCPMPTGPRGITRIKSNDIAVTLPSHKLIQFLTVTENGGLSKTNAILVKGSCKGIVYHKNKLIVSFDFPDNEIQILNLQGAVQQVLDSVGSTGMNSSYAGIALSPDHRFIYIADENQDAVISMTLDGKIKAIYRHEQLKKPQGLAVAETGIVYVCGQRRVYELSADLREGRVMMDQSQRLKSAQSLVFSDKEQRLFVGMRNDTVKVFTIKTE